ncbi:DMT family transporter [Microbacterium tumbae]
MIRWLYLGGAIVTEVTGSLAMKAALDAPWLYAVTAVGYIAAFAMLSGALRVGMPLGTAYGIWGACGVALTAIFSFLLFGEPITPLMGLGIVVVMAGVLCVELGSQVAARRAEGES